MKCQYCKTEINSLSSNCPLCGKHLSDSDVHSDAAYPDIEVINHKVHNRSLRAVLFLTIVFSVAIFMINMLIPYKYLWSMIPISGMWLMWFVLGIPIIKKKVTPLMIIFDTVIVSIFLNVIDVTLNQNGWAMSYVVPFILSGSALIITVIILLTKVNWRSFYPFQLTIVIICFIPLVVRIFFSFLFWPSLVSAVYGLVTILGMLIFGYRKFKHETVKRFHI